MLAAEVVDHPEKEAEQDTQDQAGNDGKRYRPAAAAPVEIAGETAERNVQAIEAKHDETGNQEQKSEEDKNAAKIKHGADQLAAASTVAASRSSSEGWQGLVRMLTGRASLSDCSRMPLRLE